MGARLFGYSRLLVLNVFATMLVIRANLVFRRLEYIIDLRAVSIGL